jgi:glycosyltransferase involved in cell wall biosynthesis
MIIGDGPERPALERLSDELGIADRVAFVGSTRRVGDYLQALDVFVLPSGPEESFGNAAVEAMGVGLPTVVFADGGGLTEHVEDRETGFVANDQGDLVDKLSVLVRDHELRTRLGTAASASVRAKYSIDAMVDRYDDLYAGRFEALADKARPIAMAR